MEVKYKNEAFLVVGEYVCPYRYFYFVFAFCDGCAEKTKAIQLFVLWLISDHFTGAPNVNFWKIYVRKTIWDLEFSEQLL